VRLMVEEITGQIAGKIEIKGVVVGLLAALPVTELRGAIPYGVFVLKMNLFKAFAYALIGNLLPVPFLLLFLEKLKWWAEKYRLPRRAFNWWFDRVDRKKGLVERYGWIGLALFVAVPLPGTGAWTGSVAAILLRRSFGKAVSAIMCGVIIAGCVIALLTYLVEIGILKSGWVFLRAV